MTRARIAALVLLLTAALGGLGRHARAQLGERLWVLGEVLAAHSEAAAATTRLELNGARLQIATLSAPGSVAQLLDRFEAQCSDQAEASRARWREHSGDSGALLCLAQPATPRASSFLQRVARFARSADLSVFGRLRYVRVARAGDGLAHVLLARADGPLRLRDMFPEAGDAAGHDLPELPRPERARRLLSLQLSASTHSLVAYAVPGAAGPALRAYEAALRHAGFVQLQVAAASRPGTASSSFRRAGDYYVLHSFSQDGHSVLSVVRIGGQQLRASASEPGIPLASAKQLPNAPAQGAP